MTYILREKIKYLSILIRLGAFTMPYTLAMENKLGGAINYLATNVLNWLGLVVLLVAFSSYTSSFFVMKSSISTKKKKFLN
jgi:hypothetical protein